MSSQTLRVGVVMLSTIGNAVHVLPVLHSLKRHVPGCHVTWILQPSLEPLVRGNSAVDEILVLDRSRGLRGWLDLRRELARRSFDVVLSFQDYFKAGVVTALARAPRRIGIDRGRARDLNWMFTTEQLPPRPIGHMQDQFLEFLGPLDVPTVLEWGLTPTAEERARFDGLLPATTGPRVALVIGTTRPSKEWPAGRYAELADWLFEEFGAQVVLIGGLSEREQSAASEIRREAAHPPLDLRAWDMRRLVYLIDRADVVVSPDTGPLHLGVALGTPTVALMGNTNPKRVGPYHRFDDLIVDAFGDPGEEYPASAPPRDGRMERITVEAVFEKVALALERYPRSERSGQSPP